MPLVADKSKADYDVIRYRIRNIQLIFKNDDFHFIKEVLLSENEMFYQTLRKVGPVAVSCGIGLETLVLILRELNFHHKLSENGKKAAEIGSILRESIYKLLEAAKSTDGEENDFDGSTSEKPLETIDISKFRSIHSRGLMTVEKGLKPGPYVGEIGLQIATDGRIWVCFEGQSIIRFRPELSDS